MDKLVGQFRDARKELIGLVDQFPEEKRTVVFFDQWSLQDILVHLIGWAGFQIRSLDQLVVGGKPISEKNLKSSINVDLVVSRRADSWDLVYQDFLTVSADLVKKYQLLPGRFWKVPCREDGKTTPEDSIGIEIRHYTKTHGPQIKKMLKSP